jgi:hypothetical protein
VNGFKTIIGMIVLGVVSPMLVKRGLPALTPDEQTTLVAAIVAAAAVLFRTVTTTPVFSSFRKWLAANKAPAAALSSVSPDVVQAIAIAVAREFLKPTVNQEKTP